MDPAIIRTLRKEVARLEADLVRTQEALSLARRQLAEREALQRRKQAVTVVDNVTSAEHGMATSRGRAWDSLTKAANAADFTLTTLAERVGVSAATLSRARKGERSIRADVAAQIEALTGFKATGANWPGGIA